MSGPRYSLVIPVYNEADSLPQLWSRLSAVMDRLDGAAEALFVDDGSTDRSRELLLEIHRRDPRCKVICLARNFGHQIAISAGMDFALGDATIVMDADLQDPPELIPDLIRRWQDGYEVVYAIRADRTAEPRLRRWAIMAFYRLLRRLTDVDIPLDAGDFRLIDRKALEAFKRLRESNRYVRGMVSWVGFRQTGVPYKREERYAGRTKYPLAKLLKLAADGIVSFSNVPLRVALVLGFIVSAGSFLLGLLAIVLKLSGVEIPAGWTSLVVIISFLTGVQLTLMGMMGLYVGRIYEEVKSRPLYVIQEAHGLGPGVSATEPNHALTARR